MVCVGVRGSEVNFKMADSDELEAIRTRRLAELQAQHGGSSADQQKQEEEQRQMNEMKNMMLSQILQQDARARLNSIALVKPERAKQVEGMLIQMAQTGQISGQIGEAQLVDLLEKISQKTQKKTTIKFQRKKTDLDDSDDDF